MFNEIMTIDALVTAYRAERSKLSESKFKSARDVATAWQNLQYEFHARYALIREGELS